MIRCFLSVVFGLTLFYQSAGAQTPEEGGNPSDLGNNTASAESPAESSAPETADRKAYDQALEDWKKVTAEYMELVQAWHMSEPAASDRETRSKWAELQSQSRQCFDRCLEEGIRISRKGLSANPDVAVFLLRSILYRDEHDWFEGTGDAADTLLNGGDDLKILLAETNIPIGRIHRIAGISYFMTLEFEKAEKYLKLAAASQSLKEKEVGLEQVVGSFGHEVEHEMEHRKEDAQKDDLPQVRLVTSRGPIDLELFEDTAPNTVANFIYLAEKGFYNNNPFYQVLKGIRAISGDPVGDGSGSAGYHLQDENTHRAVLRGSLLMAKVPDGSKVQAAVIPHSASSQYFITLAPLAGFEKTHTVFGRVIRGWDALSMLNQVDPQAKEKEKKQATPDVVYRVEILRKREHEYKPETYESVVAEAGKSAP